MVAENDDVPKGIFPDRYGHVTGVRWPDPPDDDPGYWLLFGMLSSGWIVPTWGLVRYNEGVFIEEAIYEGRPLKYTREGLIDWLIRSDVDEVTARHLTERAISARKDQFLTT